MPAHLNVAVFGIGAFGGNHLRVYRELEEAGEPLRVAAAADPDPAAPERVRRLYGAEQPPAVYRSAEECLQARRQGRLSLDAVSVCVPPAAHYALASQALAEGLDVLLEKPVASTLEEADALVRQAEETKRILQIGHVERFNPAVAAVMPLLNGPMFFEAHRLSVFTPRALDVDVVLDLMIHDLDVVLSFAHSAVREVRAVGLPILSRKVDIANVRLEFSSGAIANFTASRVSTEQVRKLRFFQPHQYVSIDYARRDALLIDVAEDAAKDAAASAAAAAGLSFRKPAVAKGEPLQLEIRGFLDSVRSRRPPRVTARAGRDALALALRINQEISAHAERAGLGRFRRKDPS